MDCCSKAKSHSSNCLCVSLGIRRSQSPFSDRVMTIMPLVSLLLTCCDVEWRAGANGLLGLTVRPCRLGLSIGILLLSLSPREVLSGLAEGGI